MPSDLEGKPSHLLSPISYFRHLWPLKDLTLTTNQVRGWAGYLPRRGGPEPQLGPGFAQASEQLCTLMVTVLGHRGG